jgi:hypothetical protein
MRNRKGAQQRERKGGPVFSSILHGTLNPNYEERNMISFP